MNRREFLMGGGALVAAGVATAGEAKSAKADAINASLPGEHGLMTVDDKIAVILDRKIA